MTWDKNLIIESDPSCLLWYLNIKAKEFEENLSIYLNELSKQYESYEQKEIIGIAENAAYWARQEILKQIFIDPSRIDTK